jgi:hypothetical protein
MNENLEKFLVLVSDEDTSTMEQVKQRINNRKNKQMSVVTKTNNSVSLIAADVLRNLNENFKTFKPNTKNDAMRMLALLSITNNEATTKKIKQACYSFLQNRCADCENAVDVETGIEVLKIERNTQIYNESSEIDAIETEINALKDKLKLAKESAGISHTKTDVYYKVKL